MRVSVITPTIRPDGLTTVQDALSLQTLQDFEWLIGAPFNPHIDSAIWVLDDAGGGFWTLNRVYNRLIEKAQGDIIVSWQDWIHADADALQKFVDAVETTGGVVTGVGDQYEGVDKWGRPTVKIWSDPRKTTQYGSFYEINPCDNEWNFCALPRKALYEVGGFDEELDFLGFGLDGYQVNERLDTAGYPFFIDQTNESFTIRHGRERENWDKDNLLTNGKYQLRRRELIEAGKWPQISYLQMIK